MDLDNFTIYSKSQYPNVLKLKKGLKKIKAKVLDQMFLKSHNEKFEKMNCLSCANCCKTTSPIFLQTDIDRLSRVLKVKTSSFTTQYLHRDEEGDYVLNSAPCPFLGVDNKCLVYEERPKACREYPHTNRKNMHGILNLTVQNSQVCPVVHEIFQDFNKEFRK